MKRLLLVISVLAVGQASCADLVIYGATPAGIAAAVQARRMGVSAILLEPTQRIGGLTTGGLGQTDIGRKESFGGERRIERLRRARESIARVGANRPQGD